MEEPRYLKSSTFLISFPERDLMDCSEREVVMNSVLDSLQISPTAAVSDSSECKRASASTMDCDVRARSSAQSRSVSYLAGFREPLRFWRSILLELSESSGTLGA